MKIYVGKKSKQSQSFYSYLFLHWIAKWLIPQIFSSKDEQSWSQKWRNKNNKLGLLNNHLTRATIFFAKA